MAEGLRPPGAYMTINLSGPAFVERHKSFTHDLDGARAWVGQPQHEVSFVGTAEEANAAALQFYMEHLRDVDGTRNPPPPRFADVHHFAVVDDQPCFAITYVIAGEQKNIEGPSTLCGFPVATAILPNGRRIGCIGRTPEEAEAMRVAAEGAALAEADDAETFRLLDAQLAAIEPIVRGRSMVEPRTYSQQQQEAMDREVEPRSSRQPGWREKRRAAGTKRRGRR